MDVCGTPDHGAGVQWASVRLENAGGAWEGKLSGVFSSDRGDTIVIWYKGAGGYAGLSYFELWTGTAGVNLYTIWGQIFPGDPPRRRRPRRRDSAPFRSGRFGACEPHNNQCLRRSAPRAQEPRPYPA